jgi:AcrR family transcriptional regulator
MPPKALKSRRPAVLSVTDWLRTAEDLLAENSMDRFDIAGVCKRLGVTKGSFYWHFEGRDDLLAAVLDGWRRTMTLDVDARASQIGPSLHSALRYVLGLIRRPRPGRSGAIERSIRDWARIDDRARTAVIEVDQTRLAFFQALFRQRYSSEKEVSIRAYAAYAMMMGDSVLKETVDPLYQVDDYVKKFVELLLSEEASTAIDPDGEKDADLRAI